MELFSLAGSRQVHAERSRRSGTELSMTEWEILRRVDDLGPIAVSVLADRIGRSVPVASRGVRELEEDGLVRRRSDASDARVASFVTTAAGKRVRARFHATMLDEIEAALATWTAGDRTMLAALLSRFAADVRQATPEPGVSTVLRDD